MAFTFGAGPGLTRGFGTPIVRAFLQMELQVSAGKRDKDGDGIYDRVDDCPEDPEDIDVWQDEDGCPDPDNDEDGVLDVHDGAPNDPEDKDAFEDSDGVPDPDNDADGVLDVDDGCPNRPEDVDTWEDEDGCPDPDNDSDGVLDVADGAPLDPEDKDGFEDADGVPDPDNDFDGVLDPVDQCPLQPETINAHEDEDGCPDEALAQVDTTDGITRIIILEKVYFDTNRDTIKRRSFPVLNAVRDVMQAYPDIALVEVQGHTDSDGRDTANLDLSQRRAIAVIRYLIKEGVDPVRLTGVGYGEMRPIDSNRTRSGKANNRRVEFVVKGR